MAGLTATINITGMDVFDELLAIVRAVVDDPEVPQRHKDYVRDWAQSHDTDYDFDEMRTYKINSLALTNIEAYRSI